MLIYLYPYLSMPPLTYLCPYVPCLCPLSMPLAYTPIYLCLLPMSPCRMSPCLCPLVYVPLSVSPYLLPFFSGCPLKVRVGENSPSLCPTMFSVTKTGIKRRPLCTPKVKPTKSGETIERRDQVLITDFLPEASMALIFFSKRWSM